MRPVSLPAHNGDSSLLTHLLLIVEVWVQRTAISYRSHNPRSIAFSPDNSLIAVAYDHSIALFNGSSHTFLQVISNCTPLTQLSSVMFLGKAARYLGLSGGPEGDVLVWDLISSRCTYQQTFFASLSLKNLPLV